MTGEPHPEWNDIIPIHTLDMPRYDAGNRKKKNIEKIPDEITTDEELKDIKRQLREIKHMLECGRQLRKFGNIDFKRDEEPGVSLIHTENIPKYMMLNQRRDLRQQKKKE